MKTLLISSAAALMLSVGAASAATWGQDAYGNAIQVPAASQQFTSAHAIGDRVYDGTGYTGPSTATGGPVGGFPNRN